MILKELDVKHYLRPEEILFQNQLLPKWKVKFWEIQIKLQKCGIISSVKSA